ncbi:alpha-E domain-containing protein [Actibacterium sp. 188UL27-1]|uniref:alpha-E domain-containing protein n=1 Tax=Actibacterium sp. 188UL27-1 TaxID=2786961 RepID=UPI00195E849A|nr:alpha-E domain-containing protein [Actibacterium sp. 188UL27-1]MBM7066648.1 alpha-E domain-containing protein [Actibacterium sp. 188UL27-1]
MLGKTAGGLYWMFRHLERCENTARLLEAGFRIALTRPDGSNDDWGSVIDTVGARAAYMEHHDQFDQAEVVNFLLRDPANPSNVMSAIDSARNNARLVRTALSREVWEATNECWMQLKTALAKPVPDRDLPEVLGLIRQLSGQVRGALHGTMLRNDIFNFARIGTFLERADNTARILDVKYYVLLPSISQIGSSLDNVQWENILRSVGGQRSFRWINGTEVSSHGIANFLILDSRMPRSLAFCVNKLQSNLSYLEREYDLRHPCHDMVQSMLGRLSAHSIDQIFENGLHEFILAFLSESAAVGNEIERNYRFQE